MKAPKRRFLLYALVGLIFGIIDWFYLDWLAYILWGSLGNLSWWYPSYRW